MAIRQVGRAGHSQITFLVAAGVSSFKYSEDPGASGDALRILTIDYLITMHPPRSTYIGLGFNTDRFDNLIALTSQLYVCCWGSSIELPPSNYTPLLGSGFLLSSPLPCPTFYCLGRQRRFWDLRKTNHSSK